MSSPASANTPGLLLMVAAGLALLAANSPLAPAYFGALHARLGPLSLGHWINDGLMGLFFFLVGLEIKRELLAGELATWPQRLLPGVAAIGGMAAPALIYVAFNHADASALRGWAIPSATDIAFALSGLSLAGPRLPRSLRTFLSALAIFDDLGAIVIIALFYSEGLSWTELTGPAAVIVALAVPLRWLPRLEQVLQGPVSFLILPLFALANAGVPFGGMPLDSLIGPPTLGIAAGLIAGKLCGVFGAAWLMVRMGLARLPAGTGWGQIAGVSLLCGIGFTMSLFITVLAFDDTAIQGSAKAGILAGSLLAGISGYCVLRWCNRSV